MKISYNHLVNHIKENPSIEMVSESLFQLGHEHEVIDEIFDIDIDFLVLNTLFEENPN